MKKLTNDQAIVITGFTGVFCCRSFAEFHEDVECRLGRSVMTHEMASESMQEQIKAAYKDDFLSMIEGYEGQVLEADND